LVSAIVAGGCATVPQSVRVSPDAPDPFDTTSIQSQDFRDVCRAMSESMLRATLLEEDRPVVRIAFLEVENRTQEYLDEKAFLEKIRTEVFKNTDGKLQFLDRDKTSDILREREAKRSDEVSGGRLGQRYGADYFLTGVIASIDRQVAGQRSVYTRFAFRLVNAETELVVWENDYEVKKIGQTPTWNL
jgi:PBP1b-binding outer membrane lipoprotein LpoB